MSETQHTPQENQEIPAAKAASAAAEGAAAPEAASVPAPTAEATETAVQAAPAAEKNTGTEAAAPAAKKAAPKPKPKMKEQVIQVHQGAKRIHPKLAKGRFANLRIVMIVLTQLVFYGIPWLMWSGRQAVLFDIPSRHFYIFGAVLVPTDLLYLTGLLMVSAFGLFWWTTIAGRLWCGYACPQTVYTEIMLWIDHFVEGDRNKRLKLDKEPWNFRKIRIKALKYLLIFFVAAWTGISFSGWFVPIRQFVPAIFNGTAGGAAVGAAVFYGFMTWLFGHVMREKVCQHMCPYARFQSAMFDHDTLVISYDTERGEPRGARKKTAAKEETSLGDCINCTMCVQVCPVGIDIRDGLQYECIGWAEPESRRLRQHTAGSRHRSGYRRCHPPDAQCRYRQRPRRDGARKQTGAAGKHLQPENHQCQRRNPNCYRQRQRFPRNLPDRPAGKRHRRQRRRHPVGADPRIHPARIRRQR